VDITLPVSLLCGTVHQNSFLEPKNTQHKSISGQLGTSLIVIKSFKREYRCIMAELLLGAPLFPGDKEPRQCELIFQVCGTPNEKNWPGCTNLPYYSTYVPNNVMDHHERTLKNHFLKQKPL